MTWGSPGASCWALYGEKQHQVSHQWLSNHCVTWASSMPRVLGTAGQNGRILPGPSWEGAQPGDDSSGRKPKAAEGKGSRLLEGWLWLRWGAVWEG